MNQPKQSSEKSSDYDSFVPFTARMMAAMRAMESNREDALFQDPLAARLAGEDAFAQVESRLTETDQAYIAVRTRFFDDFLCNSHVHQVVLLAAGLDTRSYRLPWAEGIQVYELDFPEVLAFKGNVLKDEVPSCALHSIGADLTQPWKEKLLEEGFDPAQSSAWLIEGLLMYLSEDEVHAVLRSVSDLTSEGSHLGLDLINVKTLEYVPYKGYFQSGWDWPEELLAEHGWDADVIEPAEPAVNGGRYHWSLPPRQTDADLERVFLVKAIKGKAIKAKAMEA